MDAVSLFFSDGQLRSDSDMPGITPSTVLVQYGLPLAPCACMAGATEEQGGDAGLAKSWENQAVSQKPCYP